MLVKTHIGILTSASGPAGSGSREADLGSGLVKKGLGSESFNVIKQCRGDSQAASCIQPLQSKYFIIYVFIDLGLFTQHVSIAEPLSCSPPQREAIHEIHVFFYFLIEKLLTRKHEEQQLVLLKICFCESKVFFLQTVIKASLICQNEALQNDETGCKQTQKHI